MNFKSNLGVFVCPHIFKNTRPILYVVHEDNEWQCLCGQDDHDEDGHLIGIGHLIKRDPTIDDLHNMPNEWEAQRASVNENWVKTKCE